MCCVTLTRATFNDLFRVSRPSFVIPIFRAPASIFSVTKAWINTTTTTELITSVTRSSSSQGTRTTTTTPIKTNFILSALLKNERFESSYLSESTSTMVNQRVFENLIVTNTVFAAFCIVLMIGLTGFLIFLLSPSIRRRWLKEKNEDNNQVQQNNSSSQQKREDESKIDDSAMLSRQSSFHQFSLGPSRLNPLFEAPAGTTTTTTTQFGTLFHPHTTATTLLHPTFWTPVTQASVLSSPVQTQQQTILPSSPSTSLKKPTVLTNMTTTNPSPTVRPSSAAACKPPLPTSLPTTIPRSPRKR